MDRLRHLTGGILTINTIAVGLMRKHLSCMITDQMTAIDENQPINVSLARKLNNRYPLFYIAYETTLEDGLAFRNCLFVQRSVTARVPISYNRLVLCSPLQSIWHMYRHSLNIPPISKVRSGSLTWVNELLPQYINLFCNDTIMKKTRPIAGPAYTCGQQIAKVDLGICNLIGYVSIAG